MKKFDLKSHTSYLINYNWPGNVRELRNLIERIAILSPGNKNEKILAIVKESLKPVDEETFEIRDTHSVPLKEARENFEKEYLTTQLKKFGGNISKTAKFIGMERSALHRKLKDLDPSAASKIEPGNRRRIVRALEVTLGAGRPFSSFGPGLDVYPPSPFTQIGIRLPRDLNDSRIAERYKLLREEGVVAEVRTLVSGG